METPPERIAATSRFASASPTTDPRACCRAAGTTPPGFGPRPSALHHRPLSCTRKRCSRLPFWSMAASSLAPGTGASRSGQWTRAVSLSASRRAPCRRPYGASRQWPTGAWRRWATTACCEAGARRPSRCGWRPRWEATCSVWLTSPRARCRPTWPSSWQQEATTAWCAFGRPMPLADLHACRSCAPREEFSQSALCPPPATCSARATTPVPFSLAVRSRRPHLPPCRRRSLLMPLLMARPTLPVSRHPVLRRSSRRAAAAVVVAAAW
mmetsp:Transcript_32731/g.94206  ORF Transcript_32731/g.94206 Transcript_32731/m.94206 type:complete len:268 (+) Transcript_32731:732-1535(+)